MDEWAWEQLRPWLDLRLELPVGPLFCVINGPTRGRPWSAATMRADLRRTATAAGVRRRFAPHQLRHAHAVEMAPRGRPADRHPAPTPPQQRRGHLDLLQGIDNAEIIETVHTRRAPMIPVNASLRA